MTKQPMDKDGGALRRELDQQQSNNDKLANLVGKMGEIYSEEELAPLRAELAKTRRVLRDAHALLVRHSREGT